MQKILSVSVFVLVFVALVFGQFGLVSAAALAVDYPGCTIGPWNPIGNAPMTVHFDATASTNAVAFVWYTADENHSSGGSTFDHVFKNPGVYKVRLTTYAAESTFNTCNASVTVKGPISQLTPAATPIFVASATSVSSTTAEIFNNSVVINGNGNNVGQPATSTIDVTLVIPTQTPVPTITPTPSVTPTATAPKQFSFWKTIVWSIVQGGKAFFRGLERGF